jgi:hypothetical protein
MVTSFNRICKKYLFLIVLSVLGLPINTNYLNRPVHHLLPFTTWNQLKPCEEAFDVQEELKKALECSNKKFFNKDPYKIIIDMKTTACYVITKESPDLKHGDGYNYFSPNILNIERIMGFYDNQLDMMFISDTADIREIYRHEMQHYFLQKVFGDGDAEHKADIWKQCEEQYYNPNKTKK